MLSELVAGGLAGVDPAVALKGQGQVQGQISNELREEGNLKITYGYFEVADALPH